LALLGSFGSTFGEAKVEKENITGILIVPET
jgi:hypothetical protein